MKFSGHLVSFTFIILNLGVAQISQAAESAKTLELSVTMNKKALAIKVTAPLDTALSQNKPPSADTEKASMQKVLAALKSDALVFTFPAAAECIVPFTNMNTEMNERTLKASDAKTAEVQAEGTGGKIIANYEGNCEKPDKLQKFESSLFTILPSAQKIVLSGLRDGKKISFKVETPKAKGPVTLDLSLKAAKAPKKGAP